MGGLLSTRRAVTALALAACAGAAFAEAPPLLLIEPDVRLAKMLAGGTEEPRPEWNAAAGALVARHARDTAISRGRTVTEMARADLSEAARQVLLLHEALLVSMRQSEYGDPPPATMPRKRSWTLGPGARALRGETGASQALLLNASGAFTGAVRGALVVIGLAAGVPTPTGLQRASASLIDLDSGDILWRKAIIVEPEADMRRDDGAHRLVTALLTSAPL